MTTLDDLWYLADEADQQAEQTLHTLQQRYEQFTAFETTKHVSRRRFRTVAERIRDNGAPYGAHTVVHRSDGRLLLVRHEGVDMWVLPGGETRTVETFQEGAARELREEAGMMARYDGLAMLGRVQFRAGGHATWGVLPIFEAAVGPDPPAPTVEDPDDEISAARWFSDLPEDTRDREQLLAWRDAALG
ncbi:MULTISPECIES: NUDIX hydrolase [Salinibaculum]|uniref:NUDIX hydrolase n=1 Tax=Salinibaculum TaxID=2732368 RepID=UPI0030CAB632